MSDFTIKRGSYCPVCRGITLSDCSHTMQQLRATVSGFDPSPDPRLAMAREALEHIGGLSRALRQGGPDPMDLEGLSDALSEAVDLASATLTALEEGK